MTIITAALNPIPWTILFIVAPKPFQLKA